jgi:hypothetical protein
MDVSITLSDAAIDEIARRVLRLLQRYRASELLATVKAAAYLHCEKRRLYDLRYYQRTPACQRVQGHRRVAAVRNACKGPVRTRAYCALGTHNPKVAGSNPAPATQKNGALLDAPFFSCAQGQSLRGAPVLLCHPLASLAFRGWPRVRTSCSALLPTRAAR